MCAIEAEHEPKVIIIAMPLFFDNTAILRNINIFKLVPLFCNGTLSF